MAELKWTAEEEQRLERLAKAAKEAFAHGIASFRQVEQALEGHPLELMKTRAMYTIEEARINYDEATRELRRTQDEKRDEARRTEDQERDRRLETIARSSKNATWLAVVVAVVSVLVSFASLGLSLVALRQATDSMRPPAAASVPTTRAR